MRGGVSQTLVIAQFYICLELILKLKNYGMIVNTIIIILQKLSWSLESKKVDSSQINKIIY